MADEVVFSGGCILSPEDDRDYKARDTELDVPAKVIDGRTMVPIRFVAEALGCEVEFLNDARKVIIRRESNGGNN